MIARTKNKYPISVEHDKEGFEVYDEELFEKNKSAIGKAIRTAISFGHYPRLGELIHVNDEIYYVVLIVYYKSAMRYLVSDENKACVEEN